MRVHYFSCRLSFHSSFLFLFLFFLFSSPLFPPSIHPLPLPFLFIMTKLSALLLLVPYFLASVAAQGQGQGTIGNSDCVQSYDPTHDYFSASKITGKQQREINTNRIASA